jgi:hypothetical protein
MRGATQGHLSILLLLCYQPYFEMSKITSPRVLIKSGGTARQISDATNVFVASLNTKLEMVSRDTTP